MGSAISSFFGGGGYSAPDPVKYDPAPAREETPEEAGIRDAERRKNKARAGGIRSTLLSNPLGGQKAKLGGSLLDSQLK